MTEKNRKSRIYSTRDWQTLNFQVYALELHSQGKPTSEAVQKKLAELKEKMVADSKNHRGDKLLRFGKRLMFYRTIGDSRAEEEVWQDFTHRASITINREAGDNAYTDYRWAAKRAKDALTWANIFVAQATRPTPKQEKSPVKPVLAKQEKEPDADPQPHLSKDPDMKVWGDPLTEAETVALLNNHCDDNVPDEDDQPASPAAPAPDMPKTITQPNLPGFEQFAQASLPRVRKITRQTSKHKASARVNQYGS